MPQATAHAPLNTAKIKCVKVSRPASHGDKYWCLYRLDGFDASAEFDGSEIGEQIVLTLCEMSAAELAAIPDFPGW